MVLGWAGNGHGAGGRRTWWAGGGGGPQLRRRDRPCGQSADIHFSGSTERGRAGAMSSFSTMRVATRDRSSGAAGGGPTAISSSPRLCVAVGIPGGGVGLGFPTGVGRSGGGPVVRSFPCPVRFHSRGGRPTRSRARACSWGERPGGRACEVRRSRLIEPRGAGGAARRAAWPDFCDPHPPPPLRISSLANFETGGRERNPWHIGEPWPYRRRPARLIISLASS
jgi:hypothetical protein